jgi:hypothetical protein
VSVKDLQSLRTDQRLLLDLAAMFHLVLPGLARAWLPQRGDNATGKMLRRLARAKLLHKYTFGEREPYYVLSRRAVRLLELPPRRVGPLGWSALIQRVGVLGACVAANLEMLTAADFKRAFCELCRRGAQTGYYAVTPDDHLAWIIIDHGASGFALAKKVQKIVAQRYRVPAFRELIVAGGLVVVVATATPEKAADIETALLTEPPRYVRVRVVVVPELLPLVVLKGS